mmetsp:Transcript_27362/g.66635  ORF Transcript_27362/g.66635 Transcript_27362/m.66635 type:complete len:364 (-) Transcript_27362:2-1093(-)
MEGTPSAAACCAEEPGGGGGERREREERSSSYRCVCVSHWNLDRNRDSLLCDRIWKVSHRRNNLMLALSKGLTAGPMCSSSPSFGGGFGGGASPPAASAASRAARSAEKARAAGSCFLSFLALLTAIVCSTVVLSRRAVSSACILCCCRESLQCVANLRRSAHRLRAMRSACWSMKSIIMGPTTSSQFLRAETAVSSSSSSSVCDTMSCGTTVWAILSFIASLCLRSSSTEAGLKASGSWISVVGLAQNPMRLFWSSRHCFWSSSSLISRRRCSAVILASDMSVKAALFEYLTDSLSSAFIGSSSFPTPSFSPPFGAIALSRRRLTAARGKTGSESGPCPQGRARISVYTLKHSRSQAWSASV